MPCLTVIVESGWGKERNWAFLTALGNQCIGLPHKRTLLQESAELCSLYNRNTMKLAAVWCLKLCAGTLFVLLLKFSAVLSIICGFLCLFLVGGIDCSVLLSCGLFLRLLKLHKLAVGKLDLSRGCLTWCHIVLNHGLTYIGIYL